jgi:AMMECR1 domain-containing protein
VISLVGHRGLLLPQVPVEHHWDRIQFLEQTCGKAGLPANAWKTGATLEAFTAEVFGDEESQE